jgi:hypothetical protein
MLIITLVFKKNAIFFAENWEKSQKIVIITSTPGHPAVDFAEGRRQLDNDTSIDDPERQPSNKLNFGNLLPLQTYITANVLHNKVLN